MVKNYQGGTYDPYHTHTPTSGGAVAVILYQPSEAAPLLPRKKRRRRMDSDMSGILRVGGWWCLALVLFSLVVHQIYMTCMHFVYCPPDAATRDAIRRDWEGEKSQHNILVRDWEHKSQEQAEKEEGWKRATERHEREVAQRKREEYERQERVQWARERERQQWQREVEERDRREEEERQKLHMFWGNVEAHTCTTYATREYSAQLMNLPKFWKHRLDACKATPLEVHGISYLPKACEDKGPGVVIGRWEINQQEPDCTTFWAEYNDKGCTSPGSGRKYITHHLMNVPEKSDWREFCATTPAHFNNMQFPGAQECFQSVFGVFGQWEIDYEAC
ncbi:hypothetical protein HD554DRAFT_2145783 [Boletus coccyginus]|nr:hypothetical protein HD554DRAFT_2145783 [Boletus coccyginus]